MSELPLRTRLYLSYVRFLRRYHRFSVEGLHHVLEPGAKLAVGYHGRGLPMDLGILQVILYEARGYLPKSITHAALYRLPLARDLFPYWGGVPGDGPEVAEAVGRGEVVLVAPGGTREGLRSFRERYVVDWGERRGYLKLALKYGMPIVPVGSAGVDDRFLGLNNGHAWGKRLRLPGEVPAWIGLGALGVFPVGLPWPSRVHMMVGEPMDPATELGEAPTTREHIEELHRRVTGRVQGLLDAARARVSSAGG